MKLFNALFVLSLSCSTFTLHAEGSVNHSAQASKHSVLAVTEGVASTAKVASVVVAAPLVIAGGASLATGSLIAESGNKIKSSHAHQGPLVISETTVTADPAPNQVIIIQNTTTQHTGKE
ncbi:MAG: hypothetical protein NWQ54_16720 [Paraglaciecola sp.]|uniref:hypothetical protein n=1 Tax=Pseudomonadati TaxID=3379134 RepID=UPI00273D610A|nr:hypothetical protein [Paraglaciecola sp.]MDP5031571.1 hypothetical protein [Paraglaciecola sp.]MDP5132524.1 hypothetical protein [Paraglaciecola sp.]